MYNGFTQILGLFIYFEVIIDWRNIYRFKSHHSFKVHKHAVAQSMINAFIGPEKKCYETINLM